MLGAAHVDVDGPDVFAHHLRGLQRRRPRRRAHLQAHALAGVCDEAGVSVLCGAHARHKGVSDGLRKDGEGDRKKGQRIRGKEVLGYCSVLRLSGSLIRMLGGGVQKRKEKETREVRAAHLCRPRRSE